MSDNEDFGKESERLLKEALNGVDLDANGMPCIRGDECGVHHRIDESVIDNEAEYGRLITYVGDYCVVTTDNPELESPLILMKLALGQMTLDTLPDVYETCVIHVGAEGTLSDMRKLSEDEKIRSLRFVQKHDSWENFQNAHNAVLSGIRDGLLDLSTPVREQ